MYTVKQPFLFVTVAVFLISAPSFAKAHKAIKKPVPARTLQKTTYDRFVMAMQKALSASGSRYVGVEISSGPQGWSQRVKTNALRAIDVDATNTKSGKFVVIHCNLKDEPKKKQVRLLKCTEQAQDKIKRTIPAADIPYSEL